MTPSTQITPSRLLQPTSHYFPHDGVALVKLSPHQSLKNAALIYESIKNMPDKTLVRGDFDRKTRPFIFFSERAKKHIGSGGVVDAITAKNIEAYRKEMGNFLSSIALDGVMLKNADAKVARAGRELKKNAASTMNEQRDFTVGDIKESLHILANAYYLDEVRKKTSPHCLLGRQVTKIQNQRLRQFIAISREKADEIYCGFKYEVQRGLKIHETPDVEF